jgi:hypothetical protein
MKFLIIVFACFLFPQWSTAQWSATNFAPTGADWYYSASATFPFPPGNYPHKLTVTSKVMYQGKQCSKITGGGSETVPDPLYVFEQNSQVYFYSNETDQFELLYRFGAQAGESWTIRGLKTPFGTDSLQITVQSVSSIGLGNQTLSVQEIQYSSGNFSWGNTIVEDIGNTDFLVPKFGAFSTGPTGLRCYEDEDINYQFAPFPCDSILIFSQVTETLDQVNIDVSPNPSVGLVSFSVVSPAYFEGTVQIIDPTGRVIESAKISNGTNELDLSGLAPGLFFYLVHSEGKVVGSGKLIR